VLTASGCGLNVAAHPGLPAPSGPPPWPGTPVWPPPAHRVSRLATPGPGTPPRATCPPGCTLAARGE